MMMHVIYFLQSSPAAFYSTIGILGLLVGSFLNVVIHRLPKMMEAGWKKECCEFLKISDDTPSSGEQEKYNLISPRSACPHCQHKITALENIPVFSYLFLGGKCRSCKQAISIRYPFIELLSAVTAVVVAYHFGFSLQTAFAILLTWALIALSAIDFDCQLLPDDITLPFLWLGLLCNLFGLFTSIHSSLIGAMAGYGILWTVYMLFKIVTGKEGMGFGDFKLLAMLGAWMGWQLLPLIIILSSLCGAIIGVSMVVFRAHDKTKPIPFGPYLAIAGWIALIWGPSIMHSYNRWLLSGI